MVGTEFPEVVATSTRSPAVLAVPVEQLVDLAAILLLLAVTVGFLVALLHVFKRETLFPWFVPSRTFDSRHVGYLIAVPPALGLGVYTAGAPIVTVVLTWLGGIPLGYLLAKLTVPAREEGEPPTWVAGSVLIALGAITWVLQAVVLIRSS